MAQLEFTRRAQEVTNPVELNAIRDDIADKFLKRRKANAEGQFPETTGSLIRFQTAGAVLAAHEQGLLTPEEFLYHKQYFKAQRQNQPK
jgi:hypothetical protein